MNGMNGQSLLDLFSRLTDPRDGPALRHPLENIVVIAICAEGVEKEARNTDPSPWPPSHGSGLPREGGIDQ
jgi:hypothetical protein